jgi:site-specific DNA-methyltransferase (adenine-specific)
MEYMVGLPDKAFELAIVDPPYGIDAGNMQLGKGKGTDSRVWECSDWDRATPKKEYFDELKRVSDNQIIWGANYMAENAVTSTPCWVIWDKCQEFSGATFEMAWTSFKSPAKAFRLSRVEAYANQTKIHPTQKPVALYEWLLTNYAKPGDRILDTHLGSGSSAIAAHNLGFDFVGMELDPDYYQAAVKRFEQHKAQARLFDCDDYQRTEKDYQQDSLL